jgi:dolichol-phosphate mannosyltransferase
VDLSIVIPCYNEVKAIPKIQQEFFPVVAELAKTHSVEVIFVDDGSRDGTGLALKNAFGNLCEPGVTIRFELHEVNQGLGQAIRTGFAASRGAVIVTTDSDGTYKFSEIPTLLTYLTPDIDIVTASPYHPNGGIDNVPGYRLVLSRSSSAIYRLLTDRRIHTYTALFRAYRRQVIQQVPFESNGFLAGTELLVNAIRMGYRVAEYPTVLHSRVIGQSKAKLMRTIEAHLKFQANSLTAWYPYGTVIKGSGDTVYLYNGHRKNLFPSAEIFLSHGYHWEQIIQVSDHYLNNLPDGPAMTFRDGTLLRGSGKVVYVIEHGKKRIIQSISVFEGLGYQWKNIVTVPDSVLDDLEMGDIIDSVGKHPDGTLVRSINESIYLLEGNEKRLIPSIQVFTSWGYKWQHVVIISESELANYPLGQPVVPQAKCQFEVGQEAARINLKPDNVLSLNL